MSATRVANAITLAQSRVGELAVAEAAHLKALQRELEQQNPDAADAVALIVNTTIAGIARSVSQFSTRLGS